MSYGSLLQAAGKASKLLKAMGNERRLAVLCHLSMREHSVTELCHLVGLSQSALSQHLAKLRRDRLVKTRRSAQTVYYSVASPEVAPLLRSLSQVFGPDDGVPDRPCGAERGHDPAHDPTSDRNLWRKPDI